MRRSMAYAVAALGAAIAVAAACGFDITTQNAQSTVPVTTYRAPGADFASYRTFAIVSSVGVVSDSTGDAGAPSVSASGLLDLVQGQLTARGFVLAAAVDPTQVPPAPVAADLAVNVTALESARTDPPYWIALDGHAGPAAWGYGGYTWQYPWQWTPISFRTGTLLIEIADLKNAPAAGGSGQIDVVWAAVCHGAAVNGNYSTNQVFEAVARAFAQSPYLQTP